MQVLKYLKSAIFLSVLSCMRRKKYRVVKNMRLQTFFCYIGHWKCLKKGKAWQEKGGGKLEGVVTLKETKCYGCAYF